ncbi:MAG: type II toxin-antitoxin system RelE/ParE family toxin [Desulfobulbaceae bacterium]|nr:type II toxin-antitoxin system RelE/ParE family toxin [Desulfobulbaceae bacterium]
MKLQWTETSKNDLIAIRNFIAEDNPTAARKWIDHLREKARNIVHQPLSGRKVPELSRDDIREVVERNYRIVYQVHPDRISILTVFESHRLFPRHKISSP